MTVYLVRHADAGARAKWLGDDRMRPLTRAGRRQAADLVDHLEPARLEAVRSSPYRRCVQTVAPLAAAAGLMVRADERLAEGDPREATVLVRKLLRERTDAVLCSHGDIIPGVLLALANEDHVDLGRDPRCQKGSVWLLEAVPTDDDARGAVGITATYLAPPG